VVKTGKLYRMMVIYSEPYVGSKTGFAGVDIKTATF
jgi:hypothetical protein